MTDEQKRMQESEEDRKDRELVRWLREKGFTDLARDVADERFAHRILENQRWIDAHDFALSSDERMQESLEARLINYHAQLFDKAASYNNVVVSLGYAGFFAIWNFTRDYLQKTDNIIIAVLLGSSLLVFIAWTLMISFHNTKSAQRLGRAISADLETRDERVTAMNKAETESQKAALKFLVAWPYVFAFSVGTGFAAGFLLLVFMAGKLLNYDLSLEHIF